MGGFYGMSLGILATTSALFSRERYNIVPDIISRGHNSTEINSANN